VNQYVSYCCLILGSATLEQYMDLQQSSYERVRNSKKKMHYLKSDKFGLPCPELMIGKIIKYAAKSCPISNV
jgi:hypothetical protein